MTEALQIRATVFRNQPGFSISGRLPGRERSFPTKIFVKKRETAEAIRDALKRGASGQEIDQLILRENVQHEQRGPAQQTILAVVMATAPGVKTQLADIARRRELIGVPFKRLQSGAKALKNQGRIEYDGISQVWRESLNIDAMIEAVANGVDPRRVVEGNGVTGEARDTTQASILIADAIRDLDRRGEIGIATKLQRALDMIGEEADPKTVLTEQSKFVRFGFSSRFLNDVLSALSQIGVENTVDRDRSSSQNTLLLVPRVDMKRAADALTGRGVSFNIEGPMGLEPVP